MINQWDQSVRRMRAGRVPVRLSQSHQATAVFVVVWKRQRANQIRHSPSQSFCENWKEKFICKSKKKLLDLEDGWSLKFQRSKTLVLAIVFNYEIFLTLVKKLMIQRQNPRLCIFLKWLEVLLRNVKEPETASKNMGKMCNTKEKITNQPSWIILWRQWMFPKFHSF